MILAKRFLFYFGGFIIGLILLYLFVGGSGASCEYDYGPNARTLKNIRTKKHAYRPEVLDYLNRNHLDTNDIVQLFKYGNVLFSESNTQLDSCNIYVIEGEVSEKNLRISVENCEKIATVRTTQIN